MSINRKDHYIPRTRCSESEQEQAISGYLAWEVKRRGAKFASYIREAIREKSERELKGRKPKARTNSES